MNLHSSSAFRWVKCPLSASLEPKLPEPPKHPTAASGEYIHDMGADFIEDACRNLSFDRDKWPDATDEQYLAAEMYAKHTMGILKTYRIFGGPNTGIETKVDLSKIYTGMAGRVDFWVFSRAHNELIILDLKTGRGIVEPFRNWQLICYAAGFPTLTNDDIVVHLKIIQPRAYHPRGSVRSWKTTLGDLRPYWATLQTAAIDANSNSPYASAGPHCRYCVGKRRAACAHFRAAVMCHFDDHADIHPHELTPQAVGMELAYLEEQYELSGFYLDALREQAASMLRNGTRVPGYTMGSGTGKLGWSAGYDAVKALADFQGIEVTKEALITPTQAEKCGMDISGLATRTPGKINLKKTDLDDAERIFGGDKHG